MREVTELRKLTRPTLQDNEVAVFYVLNRKWQMSPSCMT